MTDGIICGISGWFTAHGVRYHEDVLQRDNQDASVATIKMRIAWGCGGAGRSPEPT